MENRASGFPPVAIKGGGLNRVAVRDIETAGCDSIVDYTFEMFTFRVFCVSYMAARFSCGQSSWPWVRLGRVGAADIAEKLAAFGPAVD